MERLTEHYDAEIGERCLIYIPPEKDCIYIKGYKIDGFDGYLSFCEYLKKYHDTEKELQKYKDLEEQGLLVKLPCKIGKNLYDITEFVEGYDSPDIYLIDASRIEISKDKEGLIYTIDCFDYRGKDFGTTLFTSEDKAMEAIRENGWIL